MVMYFQDDFWEAVKDLPQEQRAAAIEALVTYHFTGNDDVEEPLAKAVLTVCKKRIDLSKTRQKAGKTGGKTKQARSKPKANQKQTKSKIEPNPNQTLTSPSLSLSLSNSKREELLEEVDWDCEENETADFVVKAKDVYNEVLGSNCNDLDFIGDVWQSLSKQHQSGRTIEDVRKVCENARDNWDAKYISPRSLFVSNFGKLLNMDRGKGGVNWDAELAEYADTLSF